MSAVECVLYVRDEVGGIRRAIESARRAGADTVLVWDTGSTDGTLELAHELADRVLRWPIPEEAVHFGSMETAVVWMSRGDWVLRLDGDEMIRTFDGLNLHDLIDPYYGVWKMARARWADLGRTIQLEKSAWPDWQFRFLRNDGLSRYVGALHPRFETPHPIGECEPEAIVLDHFVDPLHFVDPEKMERRTRLYDRLSKLAGKAPEGSAEAMTLAGHRETL